MRCPVCAGPVESAEFGPGGVVFASTRVHLGLPGREPPYSLAYVVFDDGPRVLVHTTGDAPLPVGGRVRLIGASDAGDLLVESAAGA
ncbi:OB-fold domain-containing protein [Mycolicibacterium thermoresistibile]